MRDVTSSNFGIAIAYLIPGVILLLGLAQLNPALAAWLEVTSKGELTVGGFLYATLASLTLGLLASTIRWAVIDTLHHRTGLVRPSLEFRQLPEAALAFDTIIEGRYRFYQFYSNSAIALPIAEVCWLSSGASWLTVFPVAFVEVVLLAGSRDALRHYYRESKQLLGHRRLTRRRRNKRGRK